MIYLAREKRNRKRRKMPKGSQVAGPFAESLSGGWLMSACWRSGAKKLGYHHKDISVFVDMLKCVYSPPADSRERDKSVYNSNGNHPEHDIEICLDEIAQEAHKS